MTVDLGPIRAQVETDLGDPALEKLYNAAREAVDELLGPVGPILVRRTPSGPLLGLPQRAVEILTVVENRVELEAGDWFLRPSGLLLERIGRMRWHGRVDVTFQPMPDTARRDQAVVSLIKLELVHNPGVVSFKFGSFSESYAQQGGMSYAEERQAILDGLQADGGMIR
jgi:hypothetical protein